MSCFPEGSAEKNPPANVDFEMQETWVQSLGGEDPLEEGMAIHFSILAWKIPRIEDLGCYRPQGCKELDTNENLNMHTAVQILLVSLFDKWWNFITVVVQSSEFVWFFATPWTIYSKELSRSCLLEWVVFPFSRGFFWLPTYCKSQLENSCFLFQYKSPLGIWKDNVGTFKMSSAKQSPFGNVVTISRLVLLW